MEKDLAEFAATAAFHSLKAPGLANGPVDETIEGMSLQPSQDFEF